MESEVMTDYTGQLIGGPDDGNMVTSSVAEIECKEIIELKLDGPDGASHAMMCTGKYVWMPQGYFKWQLDTSTNIVVTKDDG